VEGFGKGKRTERKASTKEQDFLWVTEARLCGQGERGPKQERKVKIEMEISLKTLNSLRVARSRGACILGSSRSGSGYGVDFVNSMSRGCIFTHASNKVDITTRYNLSQCKLTL
jgi:hypothetical protein